MPELGDWLFSFEARRFETKVDSAIWTIDGSWLAICVSAIVKCWEFNTPIDRFLLLRTS